MKIKSTIIKEKYPDKDYSHTPYYEVQVNFATRKAEKYLFLTREQMVEALSTLYNVPMKIKWAR